MDSTKIVGEKIKALREAKQISVEDLMERTGLAQEQIERIESNVDIPSLAPLIKIARALGVRLGTFLDDQDGSGAVVCRKEDHSDNSISFSNNAMNARTHMQYHSLSASKPDRHMEPFIIDINKTSGQKLFGEYKELGVGTQIAYEVCWNKLTPEVEDCMKQIIEGGSKVWANSIWGSLCGYLDDDAAYEYGPENYYGKLVDMGVTMIQTDRPEFIINYLRSRGLHD